MLLILFRFYFFFFNDTATPEIYTLSLHDALPISPCIGRAVWQRRRRSTPACSRRDRKSTRLNSSHMSISYAVFCLKKKTHTLRPAGYYTNNCATAPLSNTATPY